jgi:stage II sporulation protein D
LIVGYYDTHSAALQAVESEFKAAFPDYGYTAEALSGKYTMIAMNNIRQFIFDAGEKNLRISPGHPDGGDSPALVELNGKPYRGAIELVRGAKSEITAVNIIALEDYLYGVVPMELQASSPAEALKAQAVASRTYAVNMIGKHGAEGFDMCRTDSCQVYGGYEAEDARATRAVDDTRGKVVLYKGSIAEVYFFSSSGGYTANVSHVWNSVREYPYLTAVEDNYESGDSKNYEWETVYTAAELKTKLASNGVNIGNITGVAVTKAAEGGRVIELTITGADGVKVFTNGSCRTFLGNLHSQVYTVYANDANNQTGAGGRTYASAGADGTIGNTISGGCAAIGAGGVTAVIKGNGGTAVSAGGYTGLPACGAVFRFAGRGWGHGVGMSQEGAKGMAYAGFSYIDILIHYFPGCTIG